MISINYQRFGAPGSPFQLRLRFYKEGETKFINVTKLLSGNIKRQHWSQKKQCFTPSCPFVEENNAILTQFKQKWQQAAMGWEGTVFGLFAHVEQASKEKAKPTLSEYIQSVIEELKQNKHPDGTIKGSFEDYGKLDKRLAEFCAYRKICYEKILISDVTPELVNKVFSWAIHVRHKKGYRYISKTLHAVLARAAKQKHLDMSDFTNCEWCPKPRGSAYKNETLSPAQCKKFMALELSDLPKNVNSELFHDFCKFILCTGQSACDAVALKYSDIQCIGGVEHFVFKRRKIAEKQMVPCSVPISQAMKAIMKRWEKESRDGYIFPIRNKLKLETQTTNNGDIKHFVCRLNLWLKKVGKTIGCQFPLHTYTFRHTAITNYISKGVPILYVANLMGTSVENCEKIYYNNQGDKASREKLLNAMIF